VANSAEAAKQIAQITGMSPKSVLYAARQLGEKKVIPRKSRGRYAHQVDAREVAIVTIAVMAMTDSNRTTIETPHLIQTIDKLDAGPDYEILQMGEDRTLTAFGSFVKVMEGAIEGHVDPQTGPVNALGVQFCRGDFRAWVKWEHVKDRIYFGVRELPDGMIQEATINATAIAALRKLLIKTPSAATDGAETKTPTQVQTGSASISSESPRDCNREAPLVRHKHEGSRERVKNQLPSDSGMDSLPSNDFGSEREPDGQHSRHRCFADAQH
jgi:hypothetical protein